MPMMPLDDAGRNGHTRCGLHRIGPWSRRLVASAGFCHRPTGRGSCRRELLLPQEVDSFSPRETSARRNRFTARSSPQRWFFCSHLPRCSYVESSEPTGVLGLPGIVDYPAFRPKTSTPQPRFQSPCAWCSPLCTSHAVIYRRTSMSLRTIPSPSCSNPVWNKHSRAVCTRR